MDRVLRFKHHLRPGVVDEERVILLGAGEPFVLKGRLYARLASLLDGRRTVREVIEALACQASAPEVYYALARLEEKGQIAECVATIPPHVTAFWQALGADAGRMAERLAGSPVAVRALGHADPAAMIDALREAGVDVREDARIAVLVVDDYLAEGLAAWNREALSRSSPWMLIQPGGVEPWFGPLFRPGEGPCWECLAQRLRGNRPVETYFERPGLQERLAERPRVFLPAGARIAAGFAALALACWIGGVPSPVDGKLSAVDLMRSRIGEHVVVRRPQCAACGDPGIVRRRALEGVTLERRPKHFTADGGHRHVLPEEMLARHGHHISPISGVVAFLEPMPERDHPLRPVYHAAYRPGDDGRSPLEKIVHRTSAGKGRTPAQARASALGEAIERYSAHFQGDELHVRARAADLDGVAIAPDTLQPFSEAQYRKRAASAGRASLDPRDFIPLRYDKEALLDWTPAWSLTQKRRCWLPTAYCYAGYPVPPGQDFCAYTSNGNAAGSCLEEAIFQGFLELVERDAVAIWWYNRLQRPAVALDGFGEPYLHSLAEHFAGQGFDLRVLDITTDLGIPTFAALLFSPDGKRVCTGFGSHLEARLGVQRALTEVNQFFDSRPGAPSMQDATPYLGADYMRPDPDVAPRTRGDYPEVHHDDLRDDVAHCVQKAALAGLETIVLDQSRPDLGLSVVKVVVPGMRHFWPQLGPGRLYDVPVRAGWRDRPLAEAELNPLPILW
jgi:ribosomal protein S12 methylthiotransferase accessory factor